MFGPVLARGDVALVPYPDDLAARWIGWVSDQAMTANMKRDSVPSAAMEAEWIDRAARSVDQVVWAIAWRGQVVGTADIHAIAWRNRNASTGTAIGLPEARGHGVGRAAVALRTRYAFEELGLLKLKTTVAARNEPSLRMLAASGYEVVGTYRREWYRGGQWLDVHVLEVHADRWRDAFRTVG